MRVDAEWAPDGLSLNSFAIPACAPCCSEKTRSGVSRELLRYAPCSVLPVQARIHAVHGCGVVVLARGNADSRDAAVRVDFGFCCNYEIQQVGRCRIFQPVLVIDGIAWTGSFRLQLACWNFPSLQSQRVCQVFIEVKVSRRYLFGRRLLPSSAAFCCRLAPLIWQ